MKRVATFVSLLLAGSGCGGTVVPIPDHPPGAPSKADEAGFTVEGPRSWYLVGNQLTPGDDLLEVAVEAAEPIQVVDLWLDRQFAARGHATGGRVELAIDIENLAPGEHEILLAADGAEFAFAQRFFRRSHPLYVVVSNDWDTADNGDPMLERQERLHERHPSLLLTHFVGPYTFTDPSVSSARRQFLVDWVSDLRDREGDEIGLHIHPYCNFVEHAGVTCRTASSFARSTGDPTGYTVFLGSYSESEFTVLLEHAIDLFEAAGLGRPTSFRAGGWTLEPATMRALAATGFVADTSAANWARMEEWADNPGATLFQWNREHWFPIAETSQPYYPSTTDLLATASPRVPVLEVPDNGLLVDYVSGGEMIEMFQDNLGSGILSSPRVYSIGYHPPNFSETFFARMDEALGEIDRNLRDSDLGPVVYARLSDLVHVWPRQ
jgi:hypothetical protein